MTPDPLGVDVAAKPLKKKPGEFLPEIGKKKPAVGLFGDYIDGEDAMLVYDVDSDADSHEARKQPKKPKSKKSNKRLHQNPVEDSAERSLQRNIVMPREEDKQDGEEN